MDAMSNGEPRFEFTSLNFDQINGSTDAEVAIGVEADLVVIDDTKAILREPGFEVLLLAKELAEWLSARERSDFTSDLGSVREDVGAIRIAQSSEGWVISSDVTGLRGAPRHLQTIETAARGFVTKVRQQVSEAGYDPRLATEP